jgi:hypothetical protein
MMARRHVEPALPLKRLGEDDAFDEKRRAYNYEQERRRRRRYDVLEMLTHKRRPPMTQQQQRRFVIGLFSDITNDPDAYSGLLTPQLENWLEQYQDKKARGMGPRNDPDYYSFRHAFEGAIFDFVAANSLLVAYHRRLPRPRVLRAPNDPSERWNWYGETMKAVRDEQKQCKDLLETINDDEEPDYYLEVVGRYGALESLFDELNSHRGSMFRVR